jgi:hypothetical protein
MFRNLKFLGLALIAALAMSAVAVNTASADLLYGETTPATLTGSQEGTDVLWVHGGFVNCATVKYTGTTTAFGMSQITVTPSFSGCTFAGLAAKISMNECDYLLRFYIAAEDTTGAIDIQCPFGKEITITAPSLGTPKCIVHIPPQNGLGVDFTGTNIGTGTTREVTLHIQRFVRYSQTAGTAETGNCSTADNTSGGWYEGKARFTGENAAGHVGLFLA